MLHDDLSFVSFSVFQIENFADADCMNTLVTNHTIDLYGQTFHGVPCFLRSWVPANVVKCKLDPMIRISRPSSSALEQVFGRA
jgi:hypothetical protein